jgi:hypothetical protein
MASISNDHVPNEDLPPELVRRIAARLRPVCPNTPDDEFRRLVHDVARVKLKYDGDQFAALLEHVANAEGAPKIV